MFGNIAPFLAVKRFDRRSPLASPEIPITGATTARVGRTHVCSGTSADYAVTLPNPALFPGQLITFRGAGATLTRFVTLTPAAGLVAGQASIILWGLESIELQSDGVNWNKVAGQSIPLWGSIYANGATSIPTTAYTQVLLDTANGDNSTRMVDTTNHRLTIRRAGRYVMEGVASLTASGSYTFTVAIYLNGAALAYAQTTPPAATFGPLACITLAYSFASGDLIDLRIYQNSGSSQSATAGIGQQRLSATEIPAW